MNVPRRRCKLDAHERRVGYLDRAGREIERFPFARDLIRDLPVAFDSRVRRRNLLVYSHQRGDGSGCEEGISDLVGHGRGSDDASVRIVGIGLRAEDDTCHVGLLGGGEVGRESRCGADEHHEHAGCHGIERACVSDPTLAARTADAIDNIVAGHAGRLVDNEDAAEVGSATASAHTCSLPGSLASSTGSRVSMVPSHVIPEAAL